MSDKLDPGALLNMHGDTETWEEATVRVSHERDDLRAENERLHEVAAAAQRRQEELESENERLRARLERAELHRH